MVLIVRSTSRDVGRTVAYRRRPRSSRSSYISRVLSTCNSLILGGRPPVRPGPARTPGPSTVPSLIRSASISSIAAQVFEALVPPRAPPQLPGGLVHPRSAHTRLRSARRSGNRLSARAWTPATASNTVRACLTNQVSAVGASRRESAGGSPRWFPNLAERRVRPENISPCQNRCQIWWDRHRCRESDRCPAGVALGVAAGQ